MSAYYNEIDPYAAQWLRNLIAAGHIAPGDVDERSVVDVRADDLRGYRQCHFFAGIGVWSYALRLAGWPDDRGVWTGSCPCQPFSSAGRKGGIGDERHLWPHWARLIGECRPDIIFGEQVASRDGLAWLDFVCSDLEATGYAVGAVDTCAAGFGAPHIRQRLYFVADSDEAGRGLKRGAGLPGNADASHRNNIDGRGAIGELADHNCSRFEPGRTSETGNGPDATRLQSSGLCVTGDLGHANDAGSQGRSEGTGPSVDQLAARSASASFWSDCEWLPCIDGKARPTQPGLFPLAHGAPARVGRLRAYGNAIVAPQATEFIRAYLT